MTSLIDKIGGRKVVVAVGITAVALAVVYFKGDVPAGLVQVLSVVFGGFVLGNGAEHIAAQFGGKAGPIQFGDVGVEAITEPHEGLTAVEDKDIQSIKTTGEASAAALANVQQVLSLIIEKAGFNK